VKSPFCPHSSRSGRTENTQNRTRIIDNNYNSRCCNAIQWFPSWMFVFVLDLEIRRPGVYQACQDDLLLEPKLTRNIDPIRHKIEQYITPNWPIHSLYYIISFISNNNLFIFVSILFTTVFTILICNIFSIWCLMKHPDGPSMLSSAGILN